MRIKVLFFAVFSIFIIFSSCKESENDELSNSTPKLKKVTYYRGDSITSYSICEYDNSGRLIKLALSDGWYYKFTYASNRIIESRYLTGGNEVGTDTLLLNEKGLVISRASGTITYEYDMEGNFVKINHKTYHPTSYTYRNENGNTVQITEMDGDSCESIRSVMTNKFLPNTTNTIGTENMGITFNGKQDENLLSETKYIRYGPVYTSESNEIYILYTYEYEYEFDAQKRVTKRKTVGDIPNTYSTYTYYD
jgi:hypothetical protein